MNKKRLYKVEQGKKVSGVCAGLAEYFDVDVSIIRIAWALIVCCWGTGIVAYIIAALCLPTKEEVERQERVIDGESKTYYE